MKTTLRRLLPLAAAAGFLLAASTPASASSHMDAPLITLDDAANTTDVYAFVQEENGRKVLVTALGVYPFEEPGIGPNKFNFDDDVLYEIHVATGRDVAAGRATFSYQFKFDTKFKNQKTILQSYLGVIKNVDDAAQNLTQFYTVTKVDHRTRDRRHVLGKGVVPPNNQGNATPFYNQGRQRREPGQGWRGDRGRARPVHQAVHRDAGRWLRGFRRPARRRLLCRHPVDLRPAETAQPWQGLARRVQSPPDGARDPDGRTSVAISRSPAFTQRPADIASGS